MKGVFKRDRDGMRIEDFDFEAGSDLKLQGNVDLAPSGALSGTFRVGLPEPLVMRNQTQKRLGFDAFSDPDLGYCWITISLRGKIGRPQDSLGSELQSGERQPGVSPGANGVLEETFDRLTR